MSSLLLRRRAALAAQQKDEVEGGGANDGKYIVIKHKRANPIYARNVSSDFGVSYVTVTSPVFPANSGSFDLGSDGAMYAQGPGTSNTPALVKVSPPTNTVSTSLAPTVTAGNMFSIKATLMSSDCKKMKFIGNTAADPKVGTWVSGGTITTGSITLPAYSTFPMNPVGWYLDGNRDTLDYLIACENERTHWASVPSTSSVFSRDGGQTWTPVQNLIYGSQSIAGKFYFVTSHFSNDGKCCGILFSTGSNDTGDRMLYVSYDHCNTFQKANLPLNGGDTILNSFNNFKTSAKFKTWYLAGRITNSSVIRGGVLWKSTNKGNTWEPIWESPDNHYAVYFLCNDAGDKIATFTISASNQYSRPIRYSHDGGKTWTVTSTSAMLSGSTNSTTWKMSRDSYNI